ncbi:nitrate reductase molybdenum cofactor assembly chaperone [Nonomuraea sp. NPDC003727]
MTENHVRTVHLVASVLLGYPDARLFEAVPLLRKAVATVPSTPLTGFLDHLATVRPQELAEHYVAVFDFKRRCCPYLTSYAYGDTRKRGMALLRFKQAFREAGFEPADGELPDHLAVVCELSARGGTEQAVRLLREHRAGLEVLAQGLAAEGSPYARVVDAVIATLPPPTARDLRAARGLAADGPPAEAVGLEPYPIGERP